MNEPQRPKEKIIFPGEPGYKHSEESIKQALQRCKKFLMEHPGKKLSELAHLFPKETYDRREAYVRSHWDEIEV